ncbi:class A beta-lactamase [Pacificimonas sp. ICDLI1SI03]
MFVRAVGIAALLLAGAGSPGAALAQSAEVPSASSAALMQEVTKLAAGAGGVMGVAAWRLDGTGPKLLLNADQAFPMASTFKVAVAGRILEMVDEGELTLDQMIGVDPGMHVASEVIADRFVHPGLSMSVYNLLELMLTQSDNTATDVLTAAAGGPAAVTKWVRDQGVMDQRIDRDTAGLLREFYSLPATGTFMEAYEAAPDKEEMGEKAYLPNPAFDADPRDTSTPSAMATLLTRIFNGEALSAESTQVIAGIMERCRTGAGRLKGQLPPETVVAHKTGTIGGTVNDVGVITLPRGDQLVIVTFVKESAMPPADRERAIAEVARAAHDYFLFTAPQN